MEINKLSKSELIERLRQIGELTLFTSNEKNLSSNSNRSDLEELIGSLPFLLLNEQLFEKNIDISNFAKKLGIDIPTPEKKKKEDLIGRIIVSIAKFDVRKLNNLNNIIKNIESSSKINKNNFFNEWEIAIKSIDL